jgi:hypothetical protein
VRDTYSNIYKKFRILIGKIKLKSVIKIGLILFPAIFVLQLLLTSASDDYKNNIVTLQAKQLSYINSLQSPSDMKPGIVNSETRYVVDSTTDTVRLINDDNESLLCPTGMSISFRYTYSCYQTKSNLKDIEDSLSKYSAIVSPALNFLEYNPEVDFSNYSRGATNTTDRIKLFKEGVESTIDEYKNIGFKNDSVGMIITLLEESLVSIEKLEKDDNVDAFSSAVVDIQNQIISILKSEYTKSTNSSRQSSIEILKDFN